jgi:predicted site-specific integrase-resolvase
MKEHNNHIPTMLGVKETAERFGIAQHHARQLALSGAVKAVRAGRGKILINAESVAEYFNSSYLNETAPEESGIKPIPVKL